MMIENQAPLPETGELKIDPNAPTMPLRQNIIAVNFNQKLPWRLRLQISGESHTTIGMEVKDRILIGRGDPNRDAMPDLDLMPYGGTASGVSREHAQIVRQEDGLYVKDLHSTNGTRLNSFVLDPDQLYRLRDGDELSMGKVRIVIRFIKSPGF